MKRRVSRENAFLAQFELSFGHTDLDELLVTVQEYGEYRLDAFAEGLLRLYATHAAEVDAEIAANLKGWRSDRIARTSRSLLQLAVAEMLYGEQGMDSIIVNEAVELAKRYAGDKEHQFVNGVLGAVSRRHHPDARPQKQVAGQTAGKAPAEKDGPAPGGAKAAQVSGGEASPAPGAFVPGVQAAPSAAKTAERSDGDDVAAPAAFAPGGKASPAPGGESALAPAAEG